MEKERPEPPKMPPDWADPQALHNWEDEMVRYQDSVRWGDELDYTYPANGWDMLMPDLEDEDYENLTRYSG